MEFTVDFSELNLAGQLLERQGSHLDSLRNYGDTQLRIEPLDFGLILQVLHPINEAVVATAGFVTDCFGRVTQWSTEQMNRTLEGYLDADRDAHERFSSLMGVLGGPNLTYNDPRESFTQLGSAESQADADYGVEEQSAVSIVNTKTKMEDIGESATSLVTDTFDSVVDRGTTYTSRAGVSERTDPSSYLVVPDPGDDPGGELRANAGVILGGVDWVAEQIFGKSILEEYIYKPFGGDWHVISRTASAWEYGARFHEELAANYSGLPTQMQSWTGIASVAFQAAMTAFAAAAHGLNLAYLTVSDIADKIASIARSACATIAGLLRKLANKLTRMALEASVPVAGWVVAAVEGVILVGDVIAYLNRIVEIINQLLDAVADFIEGKERLVRASLLVEDLLNNVVNRAVAA